jgi:hypothetical protein
MKMKLHYCTEKTCTLLKSVAQIPLVIHGTTSFSFPAPEDIVDPAEGAAAAAAAAVSSSKDCCEIEPHAIFPNEKLFCLVKICTVADDQVKKMKKLWNQTMYI